MTISNVLIEKVDDLLPQTQCGECGYNGCRPYAEAIVKKNETIDKCAPGGRAVLHQLAEILKIDPHPYQNAVTMHYRTPSTAIIREAECIGCTKCITARPVDAILGSAKSMHSIIQQECSGCGLCVAPCPMDCIDMIELEEPLYSPSVAKKRYENKNKRIQDFKTEKLLSSEYNKSPSTKEFIQDAIERAKKRKLMKADLRHEITNNKE